VPIAIDATFSTDSSEVAYSQAIWKQDEQLWDYELAVAKADGSGAALITSSDRSGDLEPVWVSANEIFFKTRPQVNNPWELHKIVPDGFGEEVVEASSTKWFSQPSVGGTPRLSDAALLEAYRPELRYDATEAYRSDHPAIITDSYVSGDHTNRLLSVDKRGREIVLAQSEPAPRGDDLRVS